MFPATLQDDLVADLQELFKGYSLEAPNSESGVRQLKVFPQELPEPESVKQENISPELLENGLIEDITGNDPYPYIIVRIVDGEIKDMKEAQTVGVLLLIGVYDSSKSRQGHRKVLEIIKMIYDRYAKKPVVNKKHRLLWPIEWTLQAEESPPYYFGGLETQWEIAGIEAEDRFA